MKTIVLAYPYTSADGKTHKADKQISLPDHEANDLVYFGRARWPENENAGDDIEEN